jgi:hypothetical protein
MAAKRAERLVNLVIALLSTRQYVTAARIRATVPGYEADDGSDRADEAARSTPRTATGSPAPTTSCPRSD